MTGRVGPLAKVGLVLRIWGTCLRVRIGLARRPLPELVRELGRPGRPVAAAARPRWLGRAIYRSTALGPIRPRCITNALVHYRLLRASGVPAFLVIGLKEHPTSKDAHAWVEVDGVDVGPPPGRRNHEELARYP
ncbi:MAG: hypothetical protein KatS3mg014_1667 [Actinomycetota bacterium]|nr:MAG: hypothetical protein KatS3mg014_1667 [Actinomycetota bacterium]